MRWAIVAACRQFHIFYPSRYICDAPCYILIGPCESLFYARTNAHYCTHHTLHETLDAQHLQVLGTFVMLNILVAIILSNFTSLGNVNDNLVCAKDIANFNHAWLEFDPDACQVIPADDLPDLVRRIPAPMGIKGAPRRWAIRFCLLLEIKHNGGFLDFNDVLKALIDRNYQTEMEEGLPDQQIEMEHRVLESFGQRAPDKGKFSR